MSDFQPFWSTKAHGIGGAVVGKAKILQLEQEIPIRSQGNVCICLPVCMYHVMLNHVIMFVSI